MSAKVLSAAVVGLDGHVVEVEAAHQFGLKNFFIVGLPDAAVKEARERVQAAMRYSGFDFPRGKVAVNLAPADLKKQGTAYDLPIALAVLTSAGDLKKEATNDALFVGELALDGSVRGVPCVLLIAIAAAAAGVKRLFVPKDNATEAAFIRGIQVFPVTSLAEAVRVLRGEEEIRAVDPSEVAPNLIRDSSHDLSMIRGQESAKRALEIAAAGGHNVLLYGPPGTGKTLLARTLATILPPMSQEEAIEVTKIHAVAGVLPVGTPLVMERPFRSPHHTTSGVALVGGGANPRPGEISLAHHGVLFLDELPEFHRSVLENLRQPLEDGVVTVARAAGTIRYPAAFILTAAMNPCPCGYVSEPGRHCTCSDGQIAKYRKKISGPLLDRMDLMVEVPKVAFEKLISNDDGESSATVRDRVIAARGIQGERLKESGFRVNREMNTLLVKQFCAPSTECTAFLKTAMERLHLSARAYTRVLKVSRTIADLSGAKDITIDHIAEAIQYRPKLEARG